MSNLFNNNSNVSGGGLFSNNTTNFIHMYNKTIRTTTSVSFANNNTNMIRSKDLAKKVNEINKILEESNQKNPWHN